MQRTSPAFRICGGFSMRMVNYYGRAALRLLSGENKGKVPFKIDEKDLTESFVRGSGPGGQKINKTKNNVLLVHAPTGIAVQCQEARDLTTNRKIARKLLKDKVDHSINGADSKLGKKYEKIRKRKKNAARRASKKYGTDGVGVVLDSASDSEDEDEEDSDLNVDSAKGDSESRGEDPPKT